MRPMLRVGVLRLVVAMALLWALALPALAREEISFFQSAATLRPDGSADVTEQIDVNAEGNRIRHGIFRDIPTVLRNADGSKYYQGLTVVSVERDGASEPYTIESIPNGTRIRIGAADTVIAPGPHHFVIHYLMSRVARFFPDHDEFYWNATGNYWEFPIVSAVSTVTLPQGAVISQLVGYTGPPGSREEAVKITRTSDSQTQFRATRQLAPGEGLTVAVAFQKGIVTPPSGAGQGLNWLSDHRDIVVPAIGVLLVLLYNFFAWDAVGRDPRKGTIIPLFHPPEGTSPALVHWVHRMGWAKSGWTAITAMIFDLGVKGLVTVDNRDRQLTVTAVGKEPTTLPVGEAQLNSYFRNAGTLTIDKHTGPDLDRKRREVISAIEADNKGRYFNLNIGYIIFGFVFAGAVLGVMVWLGVLDPAWLVGGAVAGVFLGVALTMIRGGTTRTPLGLLFIAVWGVIFGLNALGAAGAYLSRSAGEVTPILAGISIIGITVLFGFLMRAPTPAGRRLMDQIDGFRMYLNTAEKHRLNLTGEPPMTISRFEAILPFAIALGVERPWTEKFNAALAANAVADATGRHYAPLWYTGGDFNPNTVASSIAAISTTMTAAMAAAVPSSSSSSGFSGGGGSGGGGGGGGGGGW